MKNWQEVYDFWIGENPKPEMWFKKDKALDDQIRAKFGPWLENFDPVDYEEWRETPRGLVSLLILLDQFPRNAFRGTRRSFEFDGEALEVAREGLEKGYQDVATDYETMFLILPFEHSEDITDQKECVRLAHDWVARAKPEYKAFAQSGLDFAIKHHDIIQKFGRFPHRNEILKRESTQDEIAFLKTPGSSF